MNDPVTRPDKSRLFTVRQERVRCPHCGHPHHRKYRSLRDRGDGAALAWLRCLHCERNFRLLQE